MAIKVLFLCVHNSARSQMAEAYLKKLGGDGFEVESAGIEAGIINPLAVEVMQMEGIDISNNQTNDVFDYYRQGKIFEHIITVCDSKTAEICPIFPGVVKIVNWPFDDPSKFTGTHKEKIQQTIYVRDQIKKSVQDFIQELKKE
jgi:arsenate reductase (thioredoxin)